MDDRYQVPRTIPTLDPIGSVRGRPAPALDSARVSLQRSATSLGLPTSFVDDGSGPYVGVRRIALLGQHSAKATLVNALFSRDLIDLVHGAGRMHVIEWGERPSLSWMDPDRRGRGPATWRELDRQPAHVSAEVRVDARLLEDPPASLIGLDLLTASLSNRENWQLLQSCHAVVMVVDATAQLTRTEVMLLREIARRAGPSLAAIAIIGIEDVAVDERPDVVDAVRRHSADLTAAGRVVVVDPDDAPALAEVLGLGAAGPRPERLHAWTQAISLILRAEELRTVALERRTQLLDVLEDQQAARAQARARGRAVDDEWLEIRLRLRSAAGQFSDDSARRVHRAAQALASSLADEFRRSPDKVAWVRESLVEGVHAGLLPIAEEFDARAGAQFALAFETVASVGLTAHRPRVELPAGPELDDLVRDALAPLERRDRVRFFARFGSALLSTGTAVAALYGVPLPSLDAVLAPIIDRSTDLSRRHEDDAARSIRMTVHRVVAQFAEDAQRSVRVAYDELLADFGEELRRQQELRAVALDIDAGPTIADLDALVAGIEAEIAHLRSLT